MGAPSSNCTRICKRCGCEYHPKSTRQQCCNKSIQVACVVCGNMMDQICTFAHQNSTCSPKCQSALIKKNREKSAQKLTKVCKYCGKEFNPKSVRDAYCAGPHYATCTVCGKEFEIIGRIDTHNKTCSEECRYISATENKDVESMLVNLKATMVEKYGLENAMQLSTTVDKVKATTKERYGTEWYTQTQEYRDKVKATSIEKYGTEHHLSAQDVIAKRQTTNLEKYGAANVLASYYGKTKAKESLLLKYGVENSSQIDGIQVLIKQNNIAKYGVEHPMMLTEFKEKARQTNMEKFGYAAPTQSHIKHIENWYKFINNPREYIQANYIEPPRTKELAEDLGVHPTTIDIHLGKTDSFDCVRRAKSLMEESIVRYIRDMTPNCRIVTNTRRVLGRHELDIYLPDYNFAIECNPTATHNSSIPDPWGGDKKPMNYHKHKTDLCAEKGIFLMHIFGYDWTNKQAIIKSMIANILGKAERVYARKCKISTVSSDIARIFFQQNHRQGFTPTSVYIGLFYENELVSLMSFGRMRHTIGIDNTDLSKCWELVRFCNKLGTSVVGGASKLFKWFVTTHNPVQVRSFSDRAHTRGILYSTLGFKEVRRSDANYVWVNVLDDKAYHRINAQKSNIVEFLKDSEIDLTKSEKEIMESHGYVRVYDSGTITWEWQNT